MNEYTKKQLVDLLSKKTGHDKRCYYKWSKTDIFKKLNLKGRKETKIICNKIMGSCDRVEWDGKGDKPPFWDYPSYNTLEECKRDCNYAMSTINKKVESLLRDKEISHINRLQKDLKYDSLYMEKNNLTDIKPVHYNRITKLEINTTDEYKMYLSNVSNFTNLNQLIINEHVNGDAIITTATPPKLKHFSILSKNFNKPITLNRPIRYFKISNFHRFESNLSFDDLPDTLRILHIDHWKYNQPIKHDFLKVLIFDFGSRFNHTITNDNFPNLRSLQIECESAFNHPIDNLPKKLESLYIGRNGDFNQPINNIPKTVSEMHILGSFNHPVNRSNLPNSLDVLSLGHHFNHPVDDLPPLKSLILFNSYLKHPIVNLPGNLELLYIFESATIRDLPENLKHLMLGVWFTHKDGKIVNLPEKLTKLTFECSFKYDDRIVDYELDVKILPENLEVLNLGITSLDLFLYKLPLYFKKLKELTVIIRPDESKVFFDHAKEILDDNDIKFKIFDNCEESEEYLEEFRTVNPFDTMDLFDHFYQLYM